MSVVNDLEVFYAVFFYTV